MLRGLKGTLGLGPATRLGLKPGTRLLRSNNLLRAGSRGGLGSWLMTARLEATPGCVRWYSLSTGGEEVSDKVDDLTPGQYDKLANTYLESIGDELEQLAEDFPQIDCELSQGVMTLAIPPSGTYVINRQPPNKQIWLSSPISGPNRYDMVGGKWVTLRDYSELTKLLEEEISQTLDTEFKFDTVDS